MTHLVSDKGTATVGISYLLPVNRGANARGIRLLRNDGGEGHGGHPLPRKRDRPDANEPGCVWEPGSVASSAYPNWLTDAASYLDTLWLGMVGPALHGDLQQTVFEVGADPGAVYAFRQGHGPPEAPVVALSGVVAHVLRFSPALPVDGQDAAGEGDLHVVPLHPGQLAAYHQVFTLGEYIGRRDPGGRVGPALVFSPAAPLGVLPHPGHLAHVIHEPPKWVARPAHISSFSGLVLVRRADGRSHPPVLCYEVGLNPGSSSRGSRAARRGSPLTSAAVPRCRSGGMPPSPARESRVRESRWATARRAVLSKWRSTARQG